MFQLYKQIQQTIFGFLINKPPKLVRVGTKVQPIFDNFYEIPREWNRTQDPLCDMV
jgi:hypothetical protein